MPETIIESPDSVAKAAQQLDEIQGEGAHLGGTLTLNMGPSHPSTHGVLRILLELDGEIVTKADPDIGYLVLDTDKALSQEVKNAIESLKTSIKTRILY